MVFLFGAGPGEEPSWCRCILHLLPCAHAQRGKVIGSVVVVVVVHTKIAQSRILGEFASPS